MADLFRSKGESECNIAGMYDLSQTIGKGHFAVVKLAKHVFTGEQVAVKVIDKTKLDPISRDHLFQEVRCMKLVQHPHIVRLYEVIDTHTKLYLILELGDGDMYDYIMKNHDRGLDIETAKAYFTQILEAISYCHDLHVVHRDLKPENVIFFEKSGIVKLTDFGFSNRFETDTKLDTSCGSLAYSAPEILLGDPYDAPAVDVWSLGVLLYMLVCGDPPFQEANDSETLTMIMDCRYVIPTHIPPSCANLISSMLRRDPKQRISLRDIMSHPWMVSGGGKCCTNQSCVALVRKEHLSPQDHEKILQVMVDGGISSKAEIIRQLDADEYSNITATYYLLAESKLKKQHADQQKPSSAAGVGSGRSAQSSHSSRPPRLEHSLSSPGTSRHISELQDSDRALLGPSSPKSAPYEVLDNKFSNDTAFPEVSRTDTLMIEHQQRKFSLISEEGEEEEEAMFKNSIATVKETKSSTWSHRSPHPSLQGGVTPSATNTTSPSNSDFEQSLGNMSLRPRTRPSPQPNNPSRPLRTVTSSPQLLPLKQIHEESEITSDEDALSTHSQTSIIRQRHSSLSMASPEVARRLLSKRRSKERKAASGSDTSDNDDDKSKDPICNISTPLSLPHKRKDSGGNSSDNDGPSSSGSGATSGATRSFSTNNTHSSQRTTDSKPNSSKRGSPCAKKQYNGGSSRCSISNNISCASSNTVAAITEVVTSTELSAGSSREQPYHSTDSSKTSATADQRRSSNGNNNNKDDNSLRVRASKLVDSSLARLSNFSLSSQTSSISSKSSTKCSGDRTSTTPRSSQRGSGAGSRSTESSGKFSKAKLIQSIKKDFNELSGSELTDSDCGSLHSSSIRLKMSTGSAVPGSNKEYSIIAEEQSSYHPSHKRTPECCSIM